MKTLDELYGQMMKDFTARTGLEASATGDLAVRLYAVAAEIYSLYVQADWMVRQCFPQSAAGEYLERHAALRGLTRRPAARAQGSIRFSADTAPAANLTIPKGTVCLTAGAVRFETLEQGFIRPGQTAVEVAAQAVEPGAAGNGAEGSVLTMAVAPVGVSRCANPQAFVGGVDQEEDEALRERVLETFRRLPNGANAAFYQQGALTFSQVAAASVIPRSRGIGTVDVVIATQEGTPGQELLDQVQSYFEQRREIAVDVKVKGPRTQTVNMIGKVQAAQASRQAAVEAAVKQALVSYFNGGLLGKNLLRAELGRVIYEVDGVENYQLTAPATDLVMAADQLPVLGTLTIGGLA